MFILRQRLKQVPFRYKYYFSTINTNVYSSTVLLPSTKMPLRLEKEKLVKRDNDMNVQIN